MAAPTLVPALTLKTTTETQFITINGAPYDLRHPAQISLSQQLWLERQVPRMGTLLASIDDDTPLDPAVEKEADRILQRVAEIAIDAPPEILAQLGPAQRMAVFHAFLGLPTTPGALGSEANAEAAPSSVGRKNSRGSTGSSAATRSSGGSGRRSS